MSVENQDLIEYNKWIEEQSSFKSKFLNNLQLHHLIIAVGLLIGLNYLYQSNPDNGKYLLLFGAGVIIYFILKNRKPIEKKVIPEPVMKHIAREWLKRKIGYDKDFPDGTILEITGNCRLIYNISDLKNFSSPFRWNVGFVAVLPNGLRKEYVAFFHPYDGYNVGFIHAPTGYDGTEFPDIKYIEKQFTLIDSNDFTEPKV